MIKNWKKINKAFTLIELVIWLTIAGVFLGLVTISSIRFINDAKVKGATQEMKVYSLALLDYYDKEGKYPSNDEGLKVLIEKNYVSKTSIIDPWKTPYIYMVNDSEDGFVIKSLGSDKKDGGEDSAKDIIISENTKDESSVETETAP